MEHGGSGMGAEEEMRCYQSWKQLKTRQLVYGMMISYTEQILQGKNTVKFAFEDPEGWVGEKTYMGAVYGMTVD